MLSGLPVIYGIDPHSEETVPSTQLGSIGFTSDGRRFRYARAGSAAALVAGNLLQSSVENVTNHSLTPSAAVLGATSVTITTGEAVTANQYAEGYIVVTNTPGNGTMYKIKSHPANASATTCVFQLYEPIYNIAWTSSTRVDLVYNPYAAVVQNPATPTGCPVGVAVKAITASSYGWIQTQGSASVLAGGTLTVGRIVVANLGTAASVINGANASTEAFPYVGIAQTSGTNGENATVYLDIN